MTSVKLQTGHGPDVIPKPGDPGYSEPPHTEGTTYFTWEQTAGSFDILSHDAEGREFPAPAGWYYQAMMNDQGVEGWFGPYPSTEKMPPHVRENPYRWDGQDHDETA